MGLGSGFPVGAWAGLAPRPVFLRPYTSHYRNRSPWCADRLPSDISKMAVSTVSVGGLGVTAGQSHFDENQLWAACDSTPREGGLQTRRYGVSCFRAVRG